MALCLALSGCAPEPQSATESAARSAEPDGAQIYFSNCAGCHGREGQGAAGAYPALRGSALVNGPYGPMLMPPMYGRGAMPGFTQLLNDEEMAAVLTYIRTAWGNTGDALSAGQIAPFRHEPAQVPLDPFQGEH